MSTTRPSMTTVRTYFNLGRTRFATIARQPQFRGLLAPGDPPARMQAILTRLYELRNQPNARRQYRRELIDSSRAQSRARTEAAAQARVQEQADGRVVRRAARLRRQILANRRDAALRTFQQGVRREKADAQWWRRCMKQSSGAAARTMCAACKLEFVRRNLQLLLRYVELGFAVMCLELEQVGLVAQCSPFERTCYRLD